MLEDAQIQVIRKIKQTLVAYRGCFGRIVDERKGLCWWEADNAVTWAPWKEHGARYQVDIWLWPSSAKEGEDLVISRDEKVMWQSEWDKTKLKLWWKKMEEVVREKRLEERGWARESEREEKKWRRWSRWDNQRSEWDKRYNTRGLGMGYAWGLGSVVVGGLSLLPSWPLGLAWSRSFSQPKEERGPCYLVYNTS